MDDREETLILHWDGGRWERAATPPQGYGLNAVAARTADDVWAVGADRTDSYDRPVLLHWDGRLWSVQPGPNLDSGDAYLLDVAPLARDNVWAVGVAEDLVSHHNQPLTLHWDGGQWSRVSAPIYARASASLTCVTALAPDIVWAMGLLEHDTLTETLVLQWDGRAWKEGPALTFNAVHTEIEDCLALSPHEVYAVGWLQATANGPTESLVVRWDGRQWTRLVSANPGGQTNFLSAIAVAGDNLWTVGYSAQPDWPRRARQILVERAYRGAYPTTRP